VRPKSQARLFLIFSLVAVAPAQELRISPEDQQVWLTREDGSRVRLTDGPAYKGSPAWSPDRSRLAYFRYCPQADCAPEIVIGNLSGGEQLSFQVVSPRNDAVCASVMRIDWLDESRVGLECHKNPSYSEYLEVSLPNGRVPRSWLGGGFSWSPDRTKLAYVGWVPHFSPPFAHPNYLEIDRKTVYPPEAAREIPPQADTWDKPIGYVVRERDGLYRGIHEFTSALAWSPDGGWVALADRVYDWKSEDPWEGAERNVKYSLVVANPAGQWLDCEFPEPARNPALAWTGLRTLKLETPTRQCSFSMEGGGLILKGCEPAAGAIAPPR